MAQTKFILLFLLVFSTATFAAVCFYNARKEEKELEAVSNCRDGEMLFKNDLAKNQLKYFTFGLAPDEKYAAMLHDKYHLNVCYMGCIVREGFICYNNQVDAYLGISPPKTPATN